MSAILFICVNFEVFLQNNFIYPKTLPKWPTSMNCFLVPILFWNLLRLCFHLSKVKTLWVLTKKCHFVLCVFFFIWGILKFSSQKLHTNQKKLLKLITSSDFFSMPKFLRSFHGFWFHFSKLKSSYLWTKKCHFTFCPILLILKFSSKKTSCQPNITLTMSHFHKCFFCAEHVLKPPETLFLLKQI